MVWSERYVESVVGRKETYANQHKHGRYIWINNRCMRIAENVRFSKIFGQLHPEDTLRNVIRHYV